MQRPASVTIIGAVGVIWGGLVLLLGIPLLIGLIINPTALAERIAASAGTELPAEFRGLLQSPWQRLSIVVANLIPLGIHGVLLVGAWKLLAMQERGRRLMLFFAVAYIVWQGVNFVADRVIYEPIRQQHQIQPTKERKAGIPIPIDYLYLLSIFYFLTRPAIKQAMVDSNINRGFR
ncbi:MAG: hypothetical protein N2554_03485 [Fimbriimonadales bacterium]|nr:hypothetical protein [Fimbriimonadales bacterium]